ncbi:MAG: hypothetical protein K0S92_825 [Desertimonas sp.]|jgi:hypothetical protein|nr:hypothetical protein [Desertimonas sp.]
MTWLTDAHTAMRHLMSADEPFTADDLLRIVGHPDADHGANGRNSALGSLFSQYSANGQIIAVDVARSQSAERKGGLIRVWRRAEPEPTETLFDASAYGPERQKRATRRQRPSEIRLHMPWVVLGHAKKPPHAHLLPPGMPKTKDGALRTRCERYGYEIKFDTHPMVRVCPTCWDINQ